MRRVFLLLVLVAAAGAAWWYLWPYETNLRNHRPLAAAVRKADRMALYEGLPHQESEKDLFARELGTKKTVQFHEFPFYAEALSLKEEDAKRLSDLFCDAESFNRYSSGKKCDEFHPDYCIEWQVGDDTYRALICFGCHEMKAYGPNLVLLCDIRSDPYKAFKKVLESYRKNRPDSEVWRRVRER